MASIERKTAQGEPGTAQAHPRRSPWPKRLAILALSTLASLGIAEWVLRVYWPVGGCVLGLDDTYLFAPIPNTQHVQFMSRGIIGRQVVVRVNSHGLLGPEPDQERSRPRCIVFGDSFIMSENEPYRYGYSARLSEHWDAEVEVLNAGVTGYGPDQNLLRMRDLVPRYQPDLVIFVVCSYNDFGDPVRNHLMHFDDADQLVHKPATVSQSQQDWFGERLAESHKPGLVRLWINYKRVRGWGDPIERDPTIMSDYLRAHREDYRAHVEQGEMVSQALLRDVYDADVALRPEWPSSQYKVRMFRALMDAMREFHELHGIPLLIVIAPGGVDLDPDSILAVDTERYPTYERDRLCRTAAEQSEAVGLPTLNLYPEFERQRHAVDLFEGPVDPHWNRNGMDLGARLTVEFLREQGIFDPIPRVAE